MAKILVVDDTKDITQTIKAVLEENGMKVDAYNDPAQALADFVPKKYDLALIDIRMPKISGFDMFREIRTVDDAIKVCFLTAFEVHSHEFERMFPNCGVTSFIQKPIEMDLLVKIIRSELGLC